MSSAIPENKPLPLGKQSKMFSDSEDEEEEDRQRVHNTAGDNESDIRRSMPGGQNIKLAKA